MLARRLQTAALVAANVLLPAAILVFASGFFPYKPVLPGLASFDAAAVVQPAAVFDRVVFMVVDALRSDFVFGHESGFEFTQSLIRSGAAIPFTAHATPPTVTMPRVKALTTGSVPSFLDLILNFAESDTSSSLAAQDTWLAQIRARSQNLVFYGDDTWLKLFPAAGDAPFFARADGTSSFFVSDFTEVDLNVTRHVPGELARADWHAMILHYLGLDHIGHKTGPQGPNMLPKQREMDGIVQMIFEAMQHEAHLANTLLILAGDHGMNAGGNHGGSGPGETEPALLFASPKLRNMRRRREYECPTLPRVGTEFHYYTKVQQSDLVPTLAGMLGLPVSRNSLGVFIPELNGFWSEEETTMLLRQNAAQIRQIIEALHGAQVFEAAVEKYAAQQMATHEACEAAEEGMPRLACLWAFAHTPRDDEHAALYRFLHEAQDTLSGTASSYNIPRMAAGMGLALAIVLLAAASLPGGWSLAPTSLFFGAITLLYGVMMFASSYVEEEQHFWYWLTPAWVLVLAVSSSGLLSASSDRRVGIAAATAALLVVHRFSVRWNQTGQKHAGAPDIVHTFFPRHHVLMWALILATYVYLGVLLARRAFAGLASGELSASAAAVLVLSSVVFKLNFTQADAPELVQGLAAQVRALTAPYDLVVQARVAFGLLAAASVAVVVGAVASARASARAGLRETGGLPSLAERLHHLLTLFLLTQSRAPNVPLFLGMEVQFQAILYLLSPQTSSTFKTSEGRRPAAQIAVTTLLLAHTAYFAAGGSNSISSIDLSNAYNGVADYNIAAVGVLLFASNWAGPVWWASAAVLLLTAQPERRVALPPKKDSGARGWVEAERQQLSEDAKKALTKPDASVEAQKPESTAWRAYLAHTTLFIAAGLLAVMAACTALRTHLFIWTVFSPKYLYAMAWSLGWHLLINIGLGSLLVRLARIA